MLRPLLLLLLVQDLLAQDPRAVLPPEPPRPAASEDWLVAPASWPARLCASPDGRGVVLTNGLVRREVRVVEGAATVALDSLGPDGGAASAVLRSVRPEARIVLDGVEHAVGGLLGQRNHAFLTPEVQASLERDPSALQLVGWEQVPVAEPFGWARPRHHAADAAWPPAGVGLRLDFAFDPAALLRAGLEAASGRMDSAVGREELLGQTFTTAQEAWSVLSPPDREVQFEGEGKWGEIHAPANAHCAAERPLPEGTALVEVVVDAGTDRGKSWGPGMALDFGDRVLKLNLRPAGGGYDGAPRFGAFDGARELDQLGGRERLSLDAPWTLRMRRAGGVWHLEARRAGESWRHLHEVDLGEVRTPRAVRVGKLDPSGAPRSYSTPGEEGRCRILEVRAYGELEGSGLAALEQRVRDLARVRVSVHHELYDGLPCVAKWLTVTNGSDRTLTLDRFTSEVLAVVEGESRVETRDGVTFRTPNLWVETDYATGGANENGQRWSVHWKIDPLYETQVNYLRQTPCLLECEPSVGPAQDLEPGETFQSFRSFVLVHDSEDRARNGLARCRMYRTLAPWVTENPLMMHVRFADEESVRRAVDQCAEVGFELVILTFGSGFNMEDDSPEYLAKMRGYADYARSKGVEIGGYSLLSSRSIGGGNDVVSPPGQRPAHGSCPALTSPWGQEYYRKLGAFFPATGFTLLEHDGPYPGDFDITPRPPLQKGYEDSQWVQFWIAADFYRWCREQGIYTNTPDWYHLNGSTKSAMGYREVNWSLPRADQVLHTRQNIFDGTWTKTPTMGWMFVPLTQYHGGGAAATVEPLHEHLDHYERMLSSNLGAGVQACYRGPRLYDTDDTRALVAREVAWFKEHRAILESDIDHGASRRADGRDLDWMLHVGPTLDTPGMLVVWNPLAHPVRRTLEVDLTYTGLRGACVAARDGGDGETLQIAGDGTVRVLVEVPAGGRTAVTFTRP